MRNKIVELRAALKDLPLHEIQEKLGGLKKSELMRSIILNEKQYCTCTYERSQRNFWYSVVKPTLDKLGELTAKEPDMMEYVREGMINIPLNNICSLNADIETCVKKYFE